MNNQRETRKAIVKALTGFDEIELMACEMELYNALICLKYRLPVAVREAISQERLNVAVDVLELINGYLSEACNAKAQERAKRLDALINGG